MPTHQITDDSSVLEVTSPVCEDLGAADSVEKCRYNDRYIEPGEVSDCVGGQVLIHDRRENRWSVSSHSSLALFKKKPRGQSDLNELWRIRGYLDECMRSLISGCVKWICGCVELCYVAPTKPEKITDRSAPTLGLP